MTGPLDLYLTTSSCYLPALIIDASLVAAAMPAAVSTHGCAGKVTSATFAISLAITSTCGADCQARVRGE